MSTHPIADTGIRFRKFGLIIPMLLILSTAATGRGAVVTVNGFQIKLNGAPFVIKGMNYSPVPIGTAPGNPPYGDYFVPAFANVWKPDIDNIRAAGINVIKLYAGNPDLNAGVPGSGGNWKQFLDYCYNGGQNPVYVVMFSYTQGGVIEQGGNGLNNYIRQYDELVKSTVKHPAVFGYLVGNEIFGGVTQSALFWTNFGRLIDAAQGAGLSQGQNPFLMTAVNDEYTPQTSWPAIKLGEQSAKLRNLDSWCINIYRGPRFGGSGNSVFAQYLALMNSFPISARKPLILGEWGTPHTTRPAPAFYGTKCKQPVSNLDDVPESDMGSGRPYFDAQPTGKYLTTQWQTIAANLRAGSDQVCVGGFIFDWCDEYWKGNNNNVQVGGPNDDFQGATFAGGYWDEAGFGITSAVNQSAYGQGNPNISRTLFKGYAAVKAFYTDSSWPGDELYLTTRQLAGIRSEIKDEIHQDRKGLKRLNEVNLPNEPGIQRLLEIRLAVDQVRLLYPTDDVFEQLDRTVDKRKKISRKERRRILDQLNSHLVELQSGG